MDAFPSPETSPCGPEEELVSDDLIILRDRLQKEGLWTGGCGMEGLGEYSHAKLSTVARCRGPKLGIWDRRVDVKES